METLNSEASIPAPTNNIAPQSKKKSWKKDTKQDSSVIYSTEEVSIS